MLEKERHLAVMLSSMLDVYIQELRIFIKIFDNTKSGAVELKQ